MHAGHGFVFWLRTLFLGTVLLGPANAFGAAEAPAAQMPSPPELTRVQLTGYDERDAALRDADILQTRGIEAQVLRHISGTGFVVSAGVFKQNDNVGRMESRLRELGFHNVEQAPLSRTEDRSKVGPVHATAAKRIAGDEVMVSADLGQRAITGTAVVTTPASQPVALSAASEPESLGDWPTSDTRLSGFYQNETSYAIDNPSHWQKWRHRLYVSADGTLNDRTTWKVSGWAAYDPIFDLTSFYPQEVRSDRQTEAMFRETYLDIAAEDWQFRLGRQHVIWGEMVGLFVADVVSAKDLREFVARDFELIRIPQWAARAERFAGDLHAELLWIPYVTYDDIGVPEDDFFPGPRPVPGFDTRIAAGRTPANTLENSSYGFRLSHLSGGWDLAGFYFRSYDLAPIFAAEVSLEPEPTIVYRPEHRRMHQIGFTAAKAVGRMAVAKAEVVYNRDRWFNVTRIDETDGLVQQDFLDYIVGLDTVFARGTQLNLQFFQRRFLDYDSGIGPDRIESGTSIFLSDWFPTLRLRPELLLAYNPKRSDWMARPSITWEPPGDWRVRVGADLFNGPADSLFGQFDGQDRVYVDLRLDF